MGVGRGKEVAWVLVWRLLEGEVPVLEVRLE